jgi:hypothetical protein
MYEFEALLFSDSVKMASGLKTNQDWINEVINDLSPFLKSGIIDAVFHCVGNSDLESDKLNKNLKLTG